MKFALVKILLYIMLIFYDMSCNFLCVHTVLKGGYEMSVYLPLTMQAHVWAGCVVWNCSNVK